MDVPLNGQARPDDHPTCFGAATLRAHGAGIVGRERLFLQLDVGVIVRYDHRAGALARTESGTGGQGLGRCGWIFTVAVVDGDLA